ncbi:tetratricopeptide repeat protein, partial [bacterium]|nr:tetratricopeptide repeat protein [bacterium]
MFKRRIYILVALLMLVFMVIFFVALRQTKNMHRDPAVLMNKYYRLKTVNPDAAQQALLILLSQDKNYIPAMKEASQWYLRQQDFKQALPMLERLHERLPQRDEYTFQLAYLYYQNGKWSKARHLFSMLDNKIAGTKKIEAQQALLAMQSYLPFYQFESNHQTVTALPVTTPLGVPKPQGVGSGLKPEDRLLNQFYAMKKNNKASAEKSIESINRQYPHHLSILKEGGFLAIEQHHPYEAIDYFSQAYALTYQPSLAMQLGYLYDQVNDKPTAYQYFKLATRSDDPTLALCAENAMTNLAGLQTKALPAPYFFEVFFNPFSQTRFGLTVRPLVIRLGVEQDNALHTKQYAFFRRTDDNESMNLGQISQIYEDNVQITGIGGQITPIKGIPIVGFLEAGAAYDLVYRNRAPWRGDLRGGFMYYNEFGTKAAYFDKLTLSTNYYSDLYGDATYFTRYNNNVIAGVKTHQGIRLLQYHSSMLNLYATGRVIADTQRQFYNNIAEIGPGIEFIPTNRFNNVKIRFEHINGVYLPAGATPNPYSQYYTNTLVQLL